MRNRKQQFGPIFAGGVMTMIGVLLGPGLAQASDVATCPAENPKAEAFRNKMRALWQDQCLLTRSVAVGIAADLPELARSNHQSLIKNQMEIGNAIRPYLGDEIAQHFTDLLEEQARLACATFATAKRGEAAARADCEARAQTSAGILALFLSTLDDANWGQDVVPHALRTLAAATAEQIDCRLCENWDKDAAAFRAANENALTMADIISGGIIAQVPEKFAAGHGKHEEAEEESREAPRNLPAPVTSESAAEAVEARLTE